MHTILQISFAFAAVYLFTITTASPIESGGTFSVVQKRLNNTTLVRNRRAAYARGISSSKYNIPLLYDFAGEIGSVTATAVDPFYVEYTCPVDIGGQTLNLVFDTGSADLWVFSTSLPASAQTKHTVFNPSKSTHWKPLSRYTWSILYGDGSRASGYVGTDVVTVGGVSVSDQVVQTASQVSSDFASVDGVLGLAFSSINDVQPVAQQTFFDRVKPSLLSPVFTADLKYRASGTYDFGFIDSSKYIGTITYINVDSSNGVWEFTTSGFAVGSGTFQPDAIDVIADTGASMILVPNTIVWAYYGKVFGAYFDSVENGYTFPCSAALPDFIVGIGAYRATVPGYYMNYSPVAAPGSSRCFGALQSSAALGRNLLGTPFLNSQFVIFDASTPRLGFAAKSI